MSVKNYGPAVSGYLDPDSRNFENAIFQAGKPVLDKELNLNEDIANSSNQAIIKQSIPSGWLMSDPLDTSDHSAAIFAYSGVGGTPNTLLIPGALVAHVNGWVITVQHTGTTGNNYLTLPSPPAGTGTQRTDFIFLEVWRRLLSASPSAVGKSVLGKIWQNGNVKTDPANDNTLNFADDLLDVNVGSETTKRVQIQYRLRVVSGIDSFSHPYGMDDPGVLARSVPATAGAPDGNATVFAYARQSFSGDSGLWRAGDGNPSNTLGTVDGYMYAIPLMAVNRLNTAAFNRNTNHRGSAVTAPNATDRPDLVYSSDSIYPEIINERNIVDLRQTVSLTGWNYKEILDKNLTLLLDNTLRTEWETTSTGGGFSGHTVLSADEVGLLPGDGVTTGDTPGATFIGQFDSARRRFSDQATYEAITVRRTPSGANWVNGEVITIDPSSIALYPDTTTFNLSARTPAGSFICDAITARYIGPGAGKVSCTPNVVSLSGFGSGSITIKTGTVAAGVTNEPMFITLILAIPPGNGMAKTPTRYFTPKVNNPGALPGSYASLFTNTEDPIHRVAHVEYLTVASNFTFSADNTGVFTSFMLPERARTVNSVTVNAVGKTFILDDTGKIVTLTGGANTHSGDVLVVNAVYQRPLPQNGAQVTFYYESRAPQAARSDLIGTDITLVPRYIADSMLVITSGSGSLGHGYPLPTAYVQTGGVYPSSIGTYTGEHELDSPAEVELSNFSAATGLLRLPTLVGYSPNPEEVVFNRDLTDIDIENRSFFSSASGGSTYDPSAYGQPLMAPTRHKVVLPMLAELATENAFGPSGMLVLVLIMRWAVLDQNNSVFFDVDPTLNTTSASVFRLKGNLLNRRS